MGETVGVGLEIASGRDLEESVLAMGAERWIVVDEVVGLIELEGGERGGSRLSFVRGGWRVV